MKKEQLRAAFEAGKNYETECLCGTCSYCLEIKDFVYPDFETWYAENYSELTHDLLLSLGFEMSGSYYFKDQVYIYISNVPEWNFEYRFNYTAVQVDTVDKLLQIYEALTNKRIR